MTSEEALIQFEEWYQSCLENGVEPEDVVSKVGEMMLLVNASQIRAFENYMATYNTLFE